MKIRARTAVAVLLVAAAVVVFLALTTGILAMAADLTYGVSFLVTLSNFLTLLLALAIGMVFIEMDDTAA